MCPDTARSPHPRLVVAGNVRRAWESNDVTALVYAINVALHGTGGLVLLLGGAEGISSPSLTVIREGLGHVAWGVGLLGLAAALVAAAYLGARAVAVVLAALSVAHLVVAAGVLASVLRDPPGPPFPTPYGVVVFMFPAAITGACAVPYWRHRGPLNRGALNRRGGRTDA